MRFGKDEDGHMWDEINLKTDEGKIYSNSAYALWEHPEDAKLERYLISCYSILKAVKLAYEAGKKGEEFILEEKEEIE